MQYFKKGINDIAESTLADFADSVGLGKEYQWMKRKIKEEIAIHKEIITSDIAEEVLRRDVTSLLPDEPTVAENEA